MEVGESKIEKKKKQLKSEERAERDGGGGKTWYVLKESILPRTARATLSLYGISSLSAGISPAASSSQLSGAFRL